MIRKVGLSATLLLAALWPMHSAEAGHRRKTAPKLVHVAVLCYSSGVAKNGIDFTKVSDVEARKVYAITQDPAFSWKTSAPGDAPLAYVFLSVDGKVLTYLFNGSTMLSTTTDYKRCWWLSKEVLAILTKHKPRDCQTAPP